MIPGSPQRGRIAGASLVVAALVAAWLGAAWWARRECLPYDVNNTDVGTWLFQAETFAAGRVWRETPEPREFFPQWQAIVRDRSFAYYPPLPALALAVPSALGLPPFLVPWLSSGLALALTFAWVRRFAGERAGVLAAFALALSPFFVANGLSVLAHAFTLLLTIVFLAVVERWRAKGARGWALAAGALLAAIFASRPLNAVALALAWVPWVFWTVTAQLAGGAVGQPLGVSGLPFRSDGRRSARPTETLPRKGDSPSGGAGRRGAFPFLIPQFSLFTAGFAAGFVPLLLYYRALAGRWTLSLFTEYWPRNRFGFGHGLGRGEPGHYFQTFADHDLAGFVANLRYSMEGLAKWWTGNAWLSGGLVLLVAWAAWRATRRRRVAAGHWVWPLLAWPAAHVLLYACYFTPSTPTTGPRYLSELMPALALATGWGVARWMVEADRLGRTLVVVGCWVVPIVATNAIGTFLVSNRLGIAARRGVERCVRDVARAPSLVFLRSFWIGHPLPIFLNRPDLRGDILFACDRGAEDRRLVERFPDRNAYILALFPEGRGVRAEMVPVYRADDRRWLRAPESVEAPFFVGSRFTSPLRLEGEVARRLFHPRPDEIVGQ